MSGASMAEVAPQGPSPAWDKRPQVEALLKDIFRLMDYPVRLDFKDLPDGSLGVAVHVDGEQPGITPGKRSFLVDCVQLLVNKAVNRPNGPRRWVNLAVNGFPEPRADKRAAPQPAPQPAPAAARANVATREDTPAPEHREPPPARESDEAALAVTPDAAWAAAARALAEKAAKLGRPYGVMLLSPENRARFLQAAAGVKGVTVTAEGEGHWRRVAFKPDKPTPMPRRMAMPDDDGEEYE